MNTSGLIHTSNYYECIKLEIQCVLKQQYVYIADNRYILQH